MATTYEAVLVAVTPASSGPPAYTEVCPLKWTGLTLLEELSGPGKTTLDVQIGTIDPAGQARLRDLTAAPCELWIRRNSTFTSSSIVAAGPVTGCHLVDQKLTITAPGLLSYMNYWLRDSDYSANLLDQATIVQQLVDQWQAQAYGHDGIVTTGLTATGVPRILNLSGRDGKFILPVITEMGSRNNGFDLTVNPANRTLQLWSPRKGSDLTSSVILDRRSIGEIDVSWSAAPGITASEMFSSSSSTTGTTLVSLRSNPTLRSTFGRSYATRSYQDIADQTTLDDYGDRALVDLGSQHFTLSPKLVPVTGFQFGDFSTGDLLKFDMDAGLGQQQFTIRVASIETKLDIGREMLAVGVL